MGTCMYIYGAKVSGEDHPYTHACTHTHTHAVGTMRIPGEQLFAKLSELAALDEMVVQEKWFLKRSWDMNGIRGKCQN